MASHTVYAVASGKGGVGKTTTTVNLGASLAEAGHTVAIVDADLGMANLGGFIGVDPDATLHEVLAGDASLEEATYEALNGLAVVPSGISLNGFANVETAALSDAVGALRDAFDYVLLDLGAGLSHDTVLPLALADAVILVSTPQPAAVQDTAKTREITERLGGRVAGVVLTRAGGTADLELEEISDTLELPVLAMLPEDDAVPASARDGMAVLQFDPDSPVAEGYRGLAAIIEAESLEDAPVVPEPPEPTAGAAVDEDEGAAEAAEDAAAGDAAATDADAADQVDATAPTDGATEAADEEPAVDPETTAAEIAAAIEDAAAGVEETDAGEGAGAEASASASEGEPDQPSGADAAEPEEPAAEPAPEAAAGGGAAGSEGTDPQAEADEQAAGEDATAADDEEPEAFKVESEPDTESAEGEAVDELFSVEGADPDEPDDEEEESGGLFSRFLG